MNGQIKRSQLLIAYATSTDPAERRKLLQQWLHAGGRELIDNAVSAGASSLRRTDDN